MNKSTALPYSIIALDLDGTLTNSEKIITPRTFDALMKAQREGVRLVLASGRPTFGIAALANQLQLADYGGYVLSYNGGRIIDWCEKTVIFSQVVDQKLVPILYDFAEKAQLPIVTYLPEAILVSKNEGEYLAEEARINGMPIVVAQNFVEEAMQIAGGSTKFLIPGEPELLIQLESEMKAALSEQMEVFRSAPFFLELPPKGIDKAQSLQRLLTHLGLERESLMAFGDGFNDLSMIQFAGQGVAMANAVEEVKSIADFVTTSNEEDGIAHALEQLLFL
ncbi:MAG: HAD family phosphatase [Alloprevotella sp.]|nr:MAG: HAD family phosphatase [Alloprevotella sp.]